MDERATALSAFVDAIAAGRRAGELVKFVELAHRAGASREELVVAVQTGLSLAQASAQLMAHAHAAIDAWYAPTMGG